MLLLNSKEKDKEKGHSLSFYAAFVHLGDLYV